MPDEESGPSLPHRSGSGLRLVTILGLGAIAALELVAASQPWWTVRLATTSIPVAGSVAAPGLTALALAGLALAFSLAIAGPVFRFILGVLQILVGLTVVVSTVFALANPSRASESLVSQATGVSGSTSVLALIVGVAPGAWGWIAASLGAIALLGGLFLLITVRAWPAASRRYQATRFVRGDGSVASGARDSVMTWDALSEGEDPTEQH